MLYLIYAQDVPNSLENRLAVRPAHGAPAGAARRRPPVVAGPNPAIDSNDPGAAGFTGSTVIAEFESLAEARARRSRILYRRRRLCRRDGEAVQTGVLISSPPNTGNARSRTVPGSMRALTYPSVEKMPSLRGCRVTRLYSSEPAASPRIPWTVVTAENAQALLDARK